MVTVDRVCVNQLRGGRVAEVCGCLSWWMRLLVGVCGWLAGWLAGSSCQEGGSEGVGGGVEGLVAVLVVLSPALEHLPTSHRCPRLGCHPNFAKVNIFQPHTPLCLSSPSSPLRLTLYQPLMHALLPHTPLLSPLIPSPFVFLSQKAPFPVPLLNSTFIWGVHTRLLFATLRARENRL